MSKADLGKIYKEKQTSRGVIYFTEMMSSMFLVLAESNDHQTLFSRVFPFTDSTKTKQRKIARDIFNKIHFNINHQLDIEEN